MQTYLRLGKIVTISALFLVLIGCGFKLRGSFDIPDYLQIVYITPNDPYEAFQRELRYRLAKNKVSVVSQAAPEVTVLEVSKPEVSEQVLADNSSGQPQRYNLIYTIRYKLTTKNKEHNREQRSITRTRALSRTNDKLLSNKNEEQLVQKELMVETVNELLRQLTTRPANNGSELDSSTSDDNPC
jgi:LPS-assembly lipoprotein